MIPIALRRNPVNISGERRHGLENHAEITIRVSDSPAERMMEAVKHISSSTEAPRSAPKPIPEAETERPSEDSIEKIHVPDPITVPEPVKSRIQARLNYDPFESDVFVEILDTQSGEVLRRFPAEKAPEDEIASRGGAILNWVA